MLDENQVNNSDEESYEYRIPDTTHYCGFCDDFWTGYGSHCPTCGEPNKVFSIDQII